MKWRLLKTEFSVSHLTFFDAQSFYLALNPPFLKYAVARSLLLKFDVDNKIMRNFEMFPKFFSFDI